MATTMTEAEYGAYPPKAKRRECPNPDCKGGRDTGKNIGLLLTVHPICSVCDGLGEVDVTPTPAQVSA
jgi:hypothetical protein